MQSVKITITAVTGEVVRATASVDQQFPARGGLDPVFVSGRITSVLSEQDRAVLSSKKGFRMNLEGATRDYGCTVDGSPEWNFKAVDDGEIGQ